MTALDPSSAADVSGGEAPPRNGVLALIGNTPLVPIRNLNPNPRVQIWAKLEKTNPGGSVKDRIALTMIEQAERSGDLVPGKTILEATSGNTGIGLAMVAAAKGYRILLAMSESVSVERRKILAALGAEFLLTPGDQGTDGAIERAYELAAEQPDRYFITDQFNNPANVLAHYENTAPEIWKQTGGKVTHLVLTMGTTGTIMGCSKRLHEFSDSIRIVGVEPYLGHKIQGLKNLKEAYVPGIHDPSRIDEKVNIDDDAAYEMARRLAREEGILVGMSSGAAMHVAAEKARELESGIIVTLFADGGERYLSTPLFVVAEPEVAPARLHLLNTLTRKYEPFEPLGGGNDVSMYSCGPTVHRRPHMGLLRRMLADDLVKRTLRYAGYRVNHVVSITDFDDNTIAEAERTGEEMSVLCARHEKEFFEDLDALGIQEPDGFVRASESVADMLSLSSELVKKGNAYEKLHSVYFNISSVPTYGELSGKDLGKIRLGATVDLDRYDKDDPRDFTLLRRSTLAEMRKDLGTKTQWGNVRPSWHVQCSAMARTHLGDRFDIHMASTDLIFPHNENEIAQSRALTGESQARFWLHSEVVLVGGKKMTWAEETYLTLPDLLGRGFSAREVRFYLLSVHYRQPVHLTDERIAAVRPTLSKIDEFLANLATITSSGPTVEDLQGWILEMRESFRQAIFDDLNMSTALASILRLVRQVNYLMTRGNLFAEDAQQVREALVRVDEVLGILPDTLPTLDVPDEVQALADRREQARQRKDFQTADRLREQIASLGYTVEDLPGGPRIKPRP